MRIRAVKAGFTSVVLAFKFLDRGRFLAQPEPDLLGIGAEDDMGQAFDVLALCSERGSGVAETRGPVPPPATAIKMFFLTHSFFDNACFSWSKATLN